jgi:magnesium chelatase family protein
MNPCPCGYLSHPQRACRCTPDAIARYQGRISGPLLDRIDMQLTVPAMSTAEMLDAPTGESSANIAHRVALARERQIARQQTSNALLSSNQIDHHCQPDAGATSLLRAAIERLHWSARAYHRVLKIARTIADLENSTHISSAHAAEAIQYRRALQSAA